MTLIPVDIADAIFYASLTISVVLGLVILALAIVDAGRARL